MKKMDPELMGEVALKVFFQLAKEWGVGLIQERQLLGVSESQHLDYKENQRRCLSENTLERISRLMAIRKGLMTLFRSKSRAGAWMSKPNSAPTFNGCTALDLILDEGSEGVEKVQWHVLALTV